MKRAPKLAVVRSITLWKDRSQLCKDDGMSSPLTAICDDGYTPGNDNECYLAQEDCKYGAASDQDGIKIYAGSGYGNCGAVPTVSIHRGDIPNVASDSTSVTITGDCSADDGNVEACDGKR